MAAVSVPSPEHTVGLMENRPLCDLGCYCPLLVVGRAAFTGDNAHNLQLTITLAFVNYGWFMIFFTSAPLKA